VSRRSFLFGLLKNDPTLQDMVGDRIFQSSSMTSANVTKPYLVYHIGNNTSENLADDHPASRYFFQVYIYDEEGDYSRVDDIGDQVKLLLMGQGSPEDKIMTTRYLERSQDLNDDTLKAIFNYLRFQWILGG
jgi:hypothetical protein